jgi:hypothetical protein
MNELQQQQPANQHGHRHPEMNVLEHILRSRMRRSIRGIAWHESPPEKTGRRALYLSPQPGSRFCDRFNTRTG